MGVTLTLTCNGCFETTTGTGPLRRRFHGTHGSWGWGMPLWDDPAKLAPEGWIISDPYTYCTYCPKCWAEVEAGPLPVSPVNGQEER